MTSLYRCIPVLLLVWLISAGLTPIQAQEATPSMPAPVQVSERPLIDVNAKDLKDLGLGIMIFVIWLFDYRRQRSLESIIEKYDETQKAHLREFTASTQQYAKLNEECRDTMLLTMEANSKVAAYLGTLVNPRSAHES